MIKDRRQMYTIIGVFALIMLLGTTTYAFFNYTKTGSANSVRTGRIAFEATEGDTVTLDGLFPIALGQNEEVTSSTPGVGSLVINVKGDTTYESGIEYVVKAVNVTAGSGSSLPISIVISYTANGTGKTIGTPDNNYFTNRGGNSSLYKVLSTDTIEDNGDLVVGYIAPGQTGIDGNITIMAYLDARNIAITDTVEGGDIVVSGYDNGTDSNWINNRQVFTTEEWNALTASGVSFQIKVEAQDGVWVDDPANPSIPITAPAIESCPGCVYKYATDEMYANWSLDETATIVDLSEYTENYEEIINTTGKDFFLGVIVDPNTDTIARAFACGIHTNETTGARTPFCIEGGEDGSKSNDNRNLLQGENLWNGACVGNFFCDSDYVAASDGGDGFVGVGDDDADCTVSTDGTMVCEAH